MIKYSIVNGDGTFEIDEMSGVISTSSNVIDREETSQYLLTVRASDCGNPSMFSDAQVVVIVDDVNDNPPIFPEVSLLILLLWLQLKLEIFGINYHKK